MKDQTSSGKDSLLVITSLQKFKAACDASNIHKGANMWLFKHYLAGPVEAVTKGRVALRTETAKSKERYLTLFSAIFSYLHKRFAKDDTITTFDTDIQNFKQDSLTATYFAE